MQKDYKPDGWLGLNIGSKLFFDFSGKYNFDEKMKELKTEIRRVSSIEVPLSNGSAKRGSAQVDTNKSSSCVIL